MPGNNGNGLSVASKRLSDPGRRTAGPQPQTEQLLAELSDRLVDRLEGAVREELSRKVFPRLEEIESKLEDATRRMSRPQQPLSSLAGAPTGQQNLQRRARSRVD